MPSAANSAPPAASGQLVQSTQEFLLNRLRDEETTFFGHATEFATVRQLMERTVQFGESNSALIIGPARSGKSTLISSVLYALQADASFAENTLVVRLDGLLDTDDGIALKSATQQMQLQNVVAGKVFGSYAENLTFLLECLRAGDRNASKSVIFVLDHFDLFCAHPKQSLLYNLFDIVQSAQAPLCVLGLTCRQDVLELLEKRVKSRFSHRQISLFPGDAPFAEHVQMYASLLRLPNRKELDVLVREAAERQEYAGRRVDYGSFVGRFTDKWVKTWNQSVEQLLSDTNRKVYQSLEQLYEFEANLEQPKLVFAQLIARLDEERPLIRGEDVVAMCTATLEADDKLQLGGDISVLEVCLLIAIMHHTEIYDREPFNFEMVLTRYRKFENSAQSRMEMVERAIAMKSFEHLHMLEIFVPLNSLAAKVQRDFQMHKLLLTNGQIKRLVNTYPHLPTDIKQWASSSIV